MKLYSALLPAFTVILAACTSVETKVSPTIEIISARRMTWGSNSYVSYEIIVRYAHADPKINYIEAGFEYVNKQIPGQGTVYHGVGDCQIPSKNGEITLVITRDKPEVFPGRSPNGKIRAYLIKSPPVPIPNSPFMSAFVQLAMTKYILTE